MNQYRKSPRAQFIHYDGGDYFITICTKGRKPYFGEICGGEMHFSQIGRYLDTQLKLATQLCGYVEIPLYVVMPNHIHAIVCIRRDVPLARIDVGLMRSPNPSLRPDPTCQRHVPTLSRYVNSLKGAVTRYARLMGVEFEWQSRYHDHYIRNNCDGNNISEYISNNVARWDTDCFYFDNDCGK